MNRRSFLGLFLSMLGSPAISSEEKPNLVKPGVNVIQEWLPLKPGPVKVRALPDSNWNYNTCVWRGYVPPLDVKRLEKSLRQARNGEHRPISEIV